MFRNLVVNRERQIAAPDPIELTQRSLQHSPSEPISLRSLNGLHENIKQRIYRALIPHHLLDDLCVDPITWEGRDKEPAVVLDAADGAGTVKLTVTPPESDDPALVIELSDNTFNSIDLNLIVLADPAGPRFATDVSEDGQPTFYGTIRRNRPAEERAKAAGLAPGQTRPGLGGSDHVLHHVESFILTLGHRAYYLEPLSYASAWVFERRGFAYMRGHGLMDTIHAEFQPGGRLHAALDSSTPFRQPDQWDSIRGRAWAIHDGILETIDAEWKELRMVKRLGKDANVATAPDVQY